MTNTDKFLEMLASSKASTRYDACEELRVASTLTEAEIQALEKTLDDSDPMVREAAEEALNAHKEPLTDLSQDGTKSRDEQSKAEEILNSIPKSYWTNNISKFQTLLLMIISTYILVSILNPFMLYLLINPPLLLFSLFFSQRGCWNF